MFLFLVKNGSGSVKVKKTSLRNNRKILDDFPYINTFIDISEIKKLYNELKNVKFEFVRAQVDLLVDADNFCSLTGMPTGIQVVKFIDTYKFTNIIDYFQENPRLLCNVKSSKYENSLECYKANKKIIVENAKKWCPAGTDIRHQIRVEFMRVCKFCTEINPIFCVGNYRFLQQFVNVKSILDMSAGRGTRMLSACVIGCDYYLGVDPNSLLHENYDDLIKFCDSKTKCHIVKSGFETDWKIPEGFPAKYDIMFTSPPYFDLEIYNNEDTQSVSKFNNLELWHEKFMFASIDKIMGMLNKNGICAININNPKGNSDRYVEPIIDYCKKKYEYLGVVNFIFRKPNGANNDSQPTWLIRCKN